LGRGDGVLDTVIVGEGASVESAQFVVEDSIERDVDFEITWGNSVLELQMQTLGRFVHRDDSELFIAALAHHGGVDIEFDRVEHNLGNRLVCRGRDGDRSAERCGSDIGPKSYLVLGWGNAAR
jgi:hypothetical protein